MPKTPRTPKMRGCVTCFVDVERIALADGSIVLFCATCDMIGGEVDVVAGGPVWAAEMGAPRLRVIARSKRTARPQKSASERSLRCAV